VLLTVRARLTVPKAGHERKHNASRADIGGCVSGYTYISRVKLLKLVKSFEKPSECVSRLCWRVQSGTCRHLSTFSSFAYIDFQSSPLYRSLSSSGTLWAPTRASTTLIMLYTRQTVVTCAWSCVYTEKSRIRLPWSWMAAASSCAISQMCSAQTMSCLNFFQSQLQRSKQMNSQQWRKKTILATDWIIKQWRSLYVLMSAKAALPVEGHTIRQQSISMLVVWTCKSNLHWIKRGPKDSSCLLL